MFFQILFRLKFDTINKKEFAAKLGEAEQSALGGLEKLEIVQSEKVAFRGASGIPTKSPLPPREFYRFWAKSVRIFSNRHR